MPQGGNSQATDFNGRVPRDRSLARIIHGSSESGVQAQTFRPQPMGLWLQGTLASPTSAYSSSPGLATPLRLYVCDLQVCPFAANFHAQG